MEFVAVVDDGINVAAACAVAVWNWSVTDDDVDDKVVVVVVDDVVVVVVDIFFRLHW